MPRKKKSGAPAWADRDDAPALTQKFFDRAEIRKGGKLVRRGCWLADADQCGFAQGEETEGGMRL